MRSGSAVTDTDPVGGGLSTLMSDMGATPNQPPRTLLFLPLLLFHLLQYFLLLLRKHFPAAQNRNGLCLQRRATGPEPLDGGSAASHTPTHHCRSRSRR